MRDNAREPRRGSDLHSPDIWSRRARILARSVLAGLVGAVAGFVLTVGAGTLSASPMVAAEAITVAAAAGAAGVVGAVVAQLWRWRREAAAVGAVVVVTLGLTVLVIGPENLSVMTPSVEIGCAFGLPRCVPTHDPKMSLLVQGGPVQRHPVVHLILWGVTPGERALAEGEERRVGALGQPLLRRDYGVDPAAASGSWTVPESPESWLHAHHVSSVPMSEMAAIIEQARRVRHWSDTPDTQWWLATGMSAEQIGLGPGLCADHTHVSGVAGVVVRLPLVDCALASSSRDPKVSPSCKPLSVVDPSLAYPAGRTAGVELVMVHEFAEAATDPTDGWHVLTVPRCRGAVLLEIADVCEPGGPFISGPAFSTAVGWQPALLAPGRGGSPARCVDPAAP